jgi:ribonuclease HI
VAIVLTGSEKIILQGNAFNTTHHEMELIAVIKAIEYASANYPSSGSINIFSDSQYVTGLPVRKQKLLLTGFATKKGNTVPHAHLVKTLLQLLDQFPVTLNKVPSHQKSMAGINNYNTEADQLSRKLVRSAIKKHFDK